MSDHPKCSKCGVPIVVWKNHSLEGFIYRWCPTCDPCPVCKDKDREPTKPSYPECSDCQRLIIWGKRSDGSLGWYCPFCTDRAENPVKQPLY